MRTISQKHVKTRKLHECWGCTDEFPKGTNMNCVVTVDDDISSSYWCEKCEKIWGMLDRFEQNEEWGMGDLRETGAWEEYHNQKSNQ